MNGVEVPTRYVLSPRTKLADAVEDLRAREGIPTTKRIGFLDLVNHRQYREIHPTQTVAVSRIKQWAEASKIQAVVWTALSSNFEEKTHAAYSVDRAVAYLQELVGTKRQQAVEYIQKAPDDVVTPLRQRLVAAGLI